MKNPTKAQSAFHRMRCECLIAADYPEVDQDLQTMREVMQSYESLLAERDRLRAALQKIADASTGAMDQSDDDLELTFDNIHTCAIAALAQSDKGK